MIWHLTKGISFKKNQTELPGEFSARYSFHRTLFQQKLKNDHPRFREEERNEIEKDEQIKFSSTFGVLLDYNIGKNWNLNRELLIPQEKLISIQKPFMPARIMMVMLTFALIVLPDILMLKLNRRRRLHPGDSVKALASTNNLQYIGLPLYAKYIFNTGGLVFYPVQVFHLIF